MYRHHFQSRWHQTFSLLRIYSRLRDSPATQILPARMLSGGHGAHRHTASLVRLRNLIRGTSAAGRRTSDGHSSSASYLCGSIRRRQGGTRVQSTWRVSSGRERSAFGPQMSCLISCWMMNSSAGVCGRQLSCGIGGLVLYRRVEQSMAALSYPYLNHDLESFN